MPLDGEKGNILNGWVDITHLIDGYKEAEDSSTYATLKHKSTIFPNNVNLTEKFQHVK